MFPKTMQQQRVKITASGKNWEVTCYSEDNSNYKIRERGNISLFNKIISSWCRSTKQFVMLPVIQSFSKDLFSLLQILRLLFKLFCTLSLPSYFLFCFVVDSVGRHFGCAGAFDCANLTCVRSYVPVSQTNYREHRGIIIPFCCFVVAVFLTSPTYISIIYEKF